MLVAGDQRAPRAAALALLADGRFPSGGHAHSGGFEAASAAHDLSDVSAVGRFLVGRLHTTGYNDAHLLAAILDRLDRGEVDWAQIDAEVDARIASPALRSTSRRLGRQWIRAGRRVWTSLAFGQLAIATEDRPHQVPAFATVAHAAGLDHAGAVVAHLHHLVAGIANSSVRLHGLDPFEVQRCQASLVPDIVHLTEEALAARARPFATLPAATGPVTELLAEEHARWDSRLFQS